MKGALVGLVVGMMALGAPRAEAHMRDFLVTEEYYTTSRGEFEVELKNNMNFPEADNSATYNSEHQIELEYGITDHLQLAYYEVFTWDRSQDWERDAFQVEAKYRFAEAGQWPVDLALYIEYKNPDGHRELRSDVLENKVILGKNLGRWNLAFNFVFEKELNNSEPWEYEYTLGASYEVTPRFQVGVEIKEGLGDSHSFRVFDGEQNLQLIPSVAFNVTSHIRMIVGPAFGLTRSSDDFQLRSIVECEF